MHDSRKVFLLDEEPRCISYSYDPEDKSTYEAKTFDLSLKVDDYIVIPTTSRHGMTVGQVVKVDIEPNLDSSQEIKWVFDKVNLETHKATVKSEKIFVDAARSAEKRRRKIQLREDFLQDVDPNIRVISGPEPTHGNSEPSAPDLDDEVPF